MVNAPSVTLCTGPGYKFAFVEPIWNVPAGMLIMVGNTVDAVFLPHPPINKEVAIIPKIKNDFIRTNNSFIENLLANNCGR
jgi:hypothetical protein